MAVNESAQVKKVVATLEGKVVSAKMDKTVVVEVVRTFRHATFGKTIRKSKNYKVHDPESASKVGDVVRIKKTAPISKTKTMVLDEVLRR